MHKLAEKIADCMKTKVEAKGIDNIEGQDLVELGMWTDIIKDLVCYDKDKKIIEAMDEAEESEEAMKYIEMYEDYPRRGYRGQPRSKTSGRFMSRRDGRRNYEEPMYYSMTPEMYHMYPSEYYRDMDREDMGRMYYSGGPSSSNASSMGGQSSSGMSSSSGNRGYTDSRQSDGGNYSSRMQRDGREGRSGEARRGYMETKEMHKGNSADDKQHKMKELENYMKELSTDITEMISDASSEEKNMLKNKLQVLMQKIN
jgi:hypothetical protein